MDAVAWRQTLLSILVFIEAIKIFDLVQNVSSIDTLYWSIKWTVLESLFIVMVWFKRIPKLRFGLITMIVLMIISWSLNWLLFGGVLSLWYRFFSLRNSPLAQYTGKDADVAGSVNDVAGSRESLLSEFKNPKKHLSGEHVVKVLPWSSVMLNPDQISFCHATASFVMPNAHGVSESLKHPTVDDAPPVFLPIVLTGVAPWRVVLASRNDSDQQRGWSKEFVIKASSVTAGPIRSSFLSEIPVTSDGIFYVASMRDGNGAEGQIRGSDVHILPCPQVRMDGTLVGNSTFNLCSASQFTVPLWLSPSSKDVVSSNIGLQIVSDAVNRTIAIDNIVLDGLERRDGLMRYNFTMDLASLFSMKDLPLPFQFLLRLESIRDSNGMSRTFGSWELGDAVIINVHGPPTASWAMDDESDSLKAVKLCRGDTSKKADIWLTGTPPFTIGVQLPDEQVLEIDHRNKEMLHSISLRQPGKYRLISVSDAHCSGRINGPTNLTVNLVNPPSLNVKSAESITSSCNTTLGLRFLMELTGEGPWTITAHYQYTPSKHTSVVRSRAPSSQVVQMVAHEQQFEYIWTPGYPGKYRLILDSISDVNFQDHPLPKNNIYEQDIIPEPSAVFADGKSLFTCLDNMILDPDVLRIPINFYGLGPWILEYSIKAPDHSTTSFKMNSDAPAALLAIDSESITRAGQYTIFLNRVTDTSGCPSSLMKTASKSLTVYASSPTISFERTKQMYVDENDLLTYDVREEHSDLVPVHVSSNTFPLTIQMLYQSPHSRHSETLEFTLDHPVKGILLNRTGIYRLTSSQDRFCKGTVGDLESIHVNTITPPSASFFPLQKSSTATSSNDDNDRHTNVDWSCSATSKGNQSINAIWVDVSGLGTISLNYSIQYSVEEADVSRARKIIKSISGKAPQIQLTVDQWPHLTPGFYRYELLSIADSRFADRPLSRSASRAFVQQILPSPTPGISLASHDSSGTFCVLDSTIDGDSKSSSMDNSSIGPFTIDYVGSEVRGSITDLIFDLELVAVHADHDSYISISKFQKVAEFKSKMPFEFSITSQDLPHAVGTFALLVTSVTSSSGCTWTQDSKRKLQSRLDDSTAVMFQTLSRPSFSLASRDSRSLLSDTSNQDQGMYFCVGDVVDVHLSGKGPWTVKHTLTSDAPIRTTQSHVDKVTSSPLHILLAEPGTLTIDSICNQKCCSDFSSGQNDKNLLSSRTSQISVYPLPSAVVQEGMQFVREGEQAEFKIGLKGGIPPYSLTYERVDEDTREVIERVVVDDIQSDEHTVRVSAGGIFRVVVVQSRHCRYPPLNK